jgi:hypothetical protein
MKNKFILILLSIIVFSCGNDDSSEANEAERLIGQWKITQRIVNGDQSDLGECEPLSVYTYNENGTYTELYYAAVANTECLDNPSVEFNGRWQKNSENSYSVTGYNNETTDIMIEFDSNNSFTKTFSVLSNPNDPIILVIAENYNRIE